ncbi:hypothetical protein [Methylobacterium isbiliense]|uniref:Uncharacterized protein n=1 Tax=Methylobacterium isbiliense TaxID=315478 RepID=A0ABQ4SI55_9HYPH|nr:hypothetical protein [Methylobacterium isbiliense]MDN3622567.1 hypothetical protein [Methylobacterium isbiliense]GJE01449.1 hypothetical protein GMJLKIPL_3380 [Methylobacterium isbiliense]
MIQRTTPHTYIAVWRERSGDEFCEETTVGNGARLLAIALATGERRGWALVEVYELDLTDPRAPVARNATAEVLAMVVEHIDRTDAIDDLPDYLEDALRRHGVRGPAEKWPARSGAGELDFIEQGRREMRLQVTGASI